MAHLTHDGVCADATPALDEPTAVLFAPHPSWIARQPQPEQKRYVTSLGRALQWSFSAADDQHT